MDEEKKYTLREAQHILALEDCSTGHLDIIELHEMGSMVSVQLMCTHCGTVYDLRKKDSDG